MLPKSINFVTWKWKSDDASRLFNSEHVNVLRAMLSRHCPVPHTLICVTDDPTGLDDSVEHFPMPVTGSEHIPSPHNRKEKVFPSCYRRLWMFSREASALGKRIFLLDIDVIITGDLSPLLKPQADFVGWCDRRFGWGKVAGGAYMLNTGSHPEVWEEFNPDCSPKIAHDSGKRGSDQAWMSYKLYPPKEFWTSGDGVIKLNWLKRSGHPPPSWTRLIFTAGTSPPWAHSLQLGHKWIPDYWKP